MKFDLLVYLYSSRRMVKYGSNGMVGTSQPLAAEIGLEILKDGGNAIDAAIGMAASLTVLEPTSNGIGSDAFCMVWSNNELHGLNSSGAAPKNISIDKIKEKGHEEMPRYGWSPVTVPGAPKAWAELSKKFGELPFKEVLEPSIRYAEEGYPIPPVIGKNWKKAFQIYKDIGKDVFDQWFNTFTINGEPPEIGSTWRSEDHAETLRSIAETRSNSFYKGEISEKIGEASKDQGGFLREKDLESFSPRWVDPISIDYRGYEVWELPPNGQGMIALMALNILKEFDFSCKSDLETYHKQIEALKIAFSDGKKYITDPDAMELDPSDFLTERYASRRRDLIEDESIDPSPGRPEEGETVYLATADDSGNMVSYIQSNYTGFGSGVVVPGTGIALQNRGNTFSLDPSHANSLGPNKRTYHTIIPGFLTMGEDAVGPFGVMGGYMQPQGHIQVLMNSIDFNHNPQAALDAPRWRWNRGRKVDLEHGVPENIAKALSRKGHEVNWALEPDGFGRGQIIWKDGDVLVGGSEPRADGCISCW